MPRLRKKPPPLHVLVAEAVALGVDTSVQISQLLGITVRCAGRELYHLSGKRCIRCVARVRTGKRGTQPRQWSVAQ